MRYAKRAILLSAVIIALGLCREIYCDPDSDCFYTPYDTAAAGRRYPALLYLSCTGATPADLDSLRLLADSLGMILAACHACRNHREMIVNDLAVMVTYVKLFRDYPIDPDRVFICGFSGQAVQALYAVFEHPRQFRGAFAVCGHEGAMPQARMAELKDKRFYLMSRQEDWNLAANRTMYTELLTSGVSVTFFIGPGSHGPPGRADFSRALQWLLENTE